MAGSPSCAWRPRRAILRELFVQIHGSLPDPGRIQGVYSRRGQESLQGQGVARASGSRRRERFIHPALQRLRRDPRRTRPESPTGRREASESRPQGPRSVPPDPNWIPDFVLLNEAPRGDRPPRPPDPHWTPDLFISEDSPSVSRPPNPSDLGSARRTYVSWLRHVSDHAGRSKSVWRSDWAGRMGMVVIFGMMLCGLWGCWIAWSYDPVEAARDAEFEANAAQQARVKHIEAQDRQPAGSVPAENPARVVGTVDANRRTFPMPRLRGPQPHGKPDGSPGPMGVAWSGPIAHTKADSRTHLAMEPQ